MVREGAAVEDELVRHFKRIDCNRDGFLNRKELAAGMVASGIALPSEVCSFPPPNHTHFQSLFRSNFSLCDWNDVLNLGHRTILGPETPLASIV